MSKNEMYVRLNQGLHLDSQDYAVKVYDYIIIHSGISNSLIAIYLPIARKIIENGLFSCSIKQLGEEIIKFVDDNMSEDAMIMLHSGDNTIIDILAQEMCLIANKLIKYLEKVYPLLSK